MSAVKNISTLDLIKVVQQTDRAGVKAWADEAAGRELTDLEFEKMLREKLPFESVYQKKIIDWLKETFRGAFVWKSTAGVYAHGGIPDVCAVIDGEFYAFEVKRPLLGEASKLQLQAIRAIKRAGGHAGVVSFIRDVARIIVEVEGPFAPPEDYAAAELPPPDPGELPEIKPEYMPEYLLPRREI